MKKLIFLILFFCSTIFAQKVEIPSLHLNDVDFEIKVYDISDSLGAAEIKFVNSDTTFIANVEAENNSVDSVFSIPETGKYNVYFNETKLNQTIRVLPGWISILPPLLAISLALIIRQVLVSLAAGIYLGAIFIYDFNPFKALLRMADTFLLDSLTDPGHILIMSITLLIGGTVGVISRNGGTTGLANQVTKLAKTSRSGMLSSWLMGLVIFFDEYANTLIIGNMVKPITDRLKISREKLAYIIDSTAASTASVAIISTWIGYEIGLISDGLKSVGIDDNAYNVFIQTIPSRFYPLASLFFVFITSFLQRDIGPMVKAEKAARKGEYTKEDKKEKNFGDLDQSFKIKDIKKVRWFNGAIPIGIFLFGTVIGLYFTGVANLKAEGIVDYNLQQIISSSESNLALFWACFIAGIVAIVMTKIQKLTTLNEAVESWQNGIKSMVFTCVILVFAWGISAITSELKTADYLISLLSESLNPHYLPALIFILCAIISFATGTSWGTMAIVIPIAIPLSFKIGIQFGLSPDANYMILLNVISSILAGAVFGDHCSPISDTTILSSMASGCNHIEHVRTQMPYAVIVAFFSLLLGSLPTAYGVSPFISNALIFISLTLFIFVFGKKITNQSLQN